MTNPDEQRHGTGSQRVPCSRCGAEVRRSPSELAATGGIAYCTRACYFADRKGVARKPSPMKGVRRGEWVSDPCATCGKLVERRASDRRPRVFCDRACYQASVRAEGRAGRPKKAQPGHTSINSHGYVVVYVEPGHWAATAGRDRALQHRVVMGDILGRPLFPNENVHHINGDRTDNRPENLELWVRSQPQGQRVEDLVAWAREIIERYG